MSVNSNYNNLPGDAIGIVAGFLLPDVNRSLITVSRKHYKNNTIQAYAALAKACDANKAKLNRLGKLTQAMRFSFVEKVVLFVSSYIPAPLSRNCERYVNHQRNARVLSESQRCVRLQKQEERLLLAVPKYAFTDYNIEP